MALENLSRVFGSGVKEWQKLASGEKSQAEIMETSAKGSEEFWKGAIPEKESDLTLTKGAGTLENQETKDTTDGGSLTTNVPDLEQTTIEHDGETTTTTDLASSVQQGELDPDDMKPENITVETSTDIGLSERTEEFRETVEKANEMNYWESIRTDPNEFTSIHDFENQVKEEKKRREKENGGFPGFPGFPELPGGVPEVPGFDLPNPLWIILGVVGTVIFVILGAKIVEASQKK